MFNKPGEGPTPIDSDVDPIVVHPETIGEVKGVVEVSSPDVFGSGVGVTLPLYDPASFPEADQVKIPKESDFIDHDDLVYKVAVDLIRGRVPMMWGPAGVGKTQLARHMAFLMQVPFERIPLGETSEREDVTGHYELKGSSTAWVQSRLARSFGRPGVTCIDEWNAAPPAVLHVARPVLDDSAQLALDAYDGRILLKHKHNFIIATGNPDWMPQYAGLLPLSESDADRLSHINVGWPDPAIEAEILLNHIKAKDLGRVTAWQLVCSIRAWGDLRQKIDEGALAITAGTRSLANFVELLQYHPVREAYSKVYERMDSQSYARVAQTLDHHNWSKYSTPLAVDLSKEVTTGVTALMDRLADLIVEKSEATCVNCDQPLVECEDCEESCRRCCGCHD